MQESLKVTLPHQNSSLKYSQLYRQIPLKENLKGNENEKKKNHSTFYPNTTV